MESSIICGKHAVLLVCNNRNSDVLRVLIADEKNINLFPKNLWSKIEVHNSTTLAKISSNSNGFICYAKPLKQINEHDLLAMKNIIALDCVQDVGNIGAILRSAAAFGVEAVIYTCDKMPNIIENQTIAKLSSGGIELVKMCQVTNLHRTLQNLQKENFWIIGTDANGEDVSQISQQYSSSKKIVVFGNEENGIKPSIRKTCDVFASIKINPQIGSLNVSAAAAIVMWEMFGVKTK